MVENVLRLAVEPWRGRGRKPLRDDHDLVGVRIDWHETDLRIAVKTAGGIRRPRQKLREVFWDTVRTLGIGHRLSAAIAAAAGFNVCGAADKRYSFGGEARQPASAESPCPSLGLLWQATR